MSENLTQAIEKFSPQWHQRLLASRIVFYGITFLTASYIAIRLLFPSQIATFNFSTPNSQKNTIAKPYDAQGSLSVGALEPHGPMIFNSPVSGIFDRLKVTIATQKKSNQTPSLKLSFKKGYQAYLFPMGKPEQYPDGSLVTLGNQFFLVSQGALRPFASKNTLTAFGLTPEAFWLITENEIGQYSTGEMIKDSSSFPDSLLVKNNDQYYQLINSQRVPFVSTRAFNSRFPQEWAVTVNDEQLGHYPQSDNFIGFVDGTLMTTPDYVGVIQGASIFPFNNPQTVESLGYHWESVIQPDGEEVGIYSKGALIDVKQPHPNGTIFSETDTQKSYRVSNGQIHPIENSSILKLYHAVAPIVVSSQSRAKTYDCSLMAGKIFTSSYSCQTQITALGNIPGNNFQFTFFSDTPLNVSMLNTTFEQPITWLALRSSLGNLKNQVYRNYIPTP